MCAAANGMETRDPAPAPQAADELAAPAAPAPPARADLRPLARALLAAALEACDDPLALPARPRCRGRPPRRFPTGR
jgi:hypothetical protein